MPHQSRWLAMLTTGWMFRCIHTCTPHIAQTHAGTHTYTHSPSTVCCHYIVFSVFQKATWPVWVLCQEGRWVSNWILTSHQQHRVASTWSNCLQSVKVKISKLICKLIHVKSQNQSTTSKTKHTSTSVHKHQTPFCEHQVPLIMP